MTTTSTSFGKRLRKLRKAAGLTQAALGEETGVHPVSIAQYELGICKPSEKSAAKLTTFFKGKPANAMPPDPLKPKKRGRPKKENAEVGLDTKVKHRLSKADLKYEKSRPVNVKKVREAAKPRGHDYVPILLGHDKSKVIPPNQLKTPVRLGLVSKDWLDQQVESFTKTRGQVFQDGPIRVVVMSRSDVVALCKLMLEIGAVRVE